MTIRIDSVLSALEAVRDTRSRNEKEKILRALFDSDQGGFFKELCLIIFNPYRQYWVTSGTIGEIENRRPLYATDTQLWRHFTALLKALQHRTVTGDDAKQDVRTFLESLPESVTPWFLKFIDKELRIGVSVKTINKVCPGLIPTFDLALCETYDGGDLRWPYMSQPKYDGVRCVIGKLDDTGQVFGLSRNGKPLWNIDHIIKAIVDAGLEDFIFDGEAYLPALDPVADREAVFNNTLSVVMTQGEHPDAARLQLHTFAAMLENEWKAQEISSSNVAIADMLDGMANVVDNPCFVSVPHVMVSSAEDAAKVAQEYFDQGFEGAVLKDPEAVYQFKRSRSWLRQKPFFSGDFEVVGANEGKGEDAEMLGSLIISVPCDTGEATVCKVGSGFERDFQISAWEDFCANPNLLVGKIAEVKFKWRTPEGALREPVFLRLRPDKR